MRSRPHRFLMPALITVSLLGCTCCHGPDGSFTPDTISFEEAGIPGKSLMVLTTKAIVYRDFEGEEWTAPVGTLTDGASVPRIFLPVTDGRYDQKFLKAAIVHDAYCQKENETVCPDQYQSRPWKKVHRMFYDACLAGGTPQNIAGVMFAAVWLGGPRWDDPDPGPGDLPEELHEIAIDGSAAFIEKEEPDLDGIVSWLEQREPVLRMVDAASSEFSQNLKRAGARGSRDSLQKADTDLDDALKGLPDDSFSDNLRAYHFQHRALTLGQKGFSTEAAQQEIKAGRLLKGVLQQRPNTPSAKTGLARIKTRKKITLETPPSEPTRTP